MPDLPAELWSIIASNVDRSDLPRLALVSLLHCKVASDALASDLRLGSSLEKGYRKVLAALKERNVLHRTRRLAIEVTRYNIEALDTEAVLLEEMPNLQDLSFSAPQVLFKTAELQDAFVLRLKQSCKKLHSLSIRLGTYDKVLPGMSFFIPNLRHINWSDGSRIRPAFLSLCSASLATITHLTVYFWAGDPEDYGPCYQLFGLRFPALQTLKIGPGDDSGCFHLKPTRQQFTQFLIAHPTIEHLDLDQWSLDGTRVNYAYLWLESEMLSPTILPNIVSLQAHPTQVTKLVNAGALFLKTMKKFVIWQNELGDIVPDVQVMFEAFRLYVDVVGPLQLLEFHLLLSHMREGFKIDRLPIKPVLEAVYDVFPSLEIYIGDIAEIEDLVILRDRLKHLRKVQTTLS